MSRNLCLTKPGQHRKKGKPEPDKIVHLFQMPTEVTLAVVPFISERWRVFDVYRTYVESVQGDSLHLDDVRDALLGGFVWSVT